MKYSRDHPSPRYAELQVQYRALHERGEPFLDIPPEQTFPGSSLPPQAGRIKKLVERTAARTLLDYGSGKGMTYELPVMKDDAGVEWPGILEFWGVENVECYDPGYPPFSRLPAGTFDGVISTDVLEHCPEDDIPWIVDEIFGYATRFVFANVACYPARKRLPTGENAHCTVKPDEWWRSIFETAAARRQGLLWEVWIDARVETPQGAKRVENKIGNA
ncbi:MAG TPA: class I SAM-dependent methyltransferase [Burkholderiales bacterium]|nr:class I SAM-dependent methyltransferase [Burkholderiales bacterium]